MNIPLIDDTKRAIYMMALGRIVSGESLGVCGALELSYYEWIGHTKQSAAQAGLTLRGQDLREFFPEFYRQFDGVRWFSTSVVPGGFSSRPVSIEHFWWSSANSLPRRLILEKILSTT